MEWFDEIIESFEILGLKVECFSYPLNDNSPSQVEIYLEDMENVVK